jgi:hypothetical protein
MLLEGMSIRAASRLSGVKADTICQVILTVGENCERFLRQTVRDVPSETIELDELWDFVAMKAATALFVA